MQTQVASVAREEGEVVILISATPVLGVDFVESIINKDCVRCGDLVNPKVRG